MRASSKARNSLVCAAVAGLTLALVPLPAQAASLPVATRVGSTAPVSVQPKSAPPVPYRLAGSVQPRATVTDPPEPTDPPEAPVPTVVPASQYTIIGFSSESPAYPAPPAVDGTAAAILTDDLAEEWTVKYADGIAADPFPHWIAFDTGKERDLTELQYAMKSGVGQAKGYDVYVSSDASVADDPEASEGWGDPVATGEFANAPGTMQQAEFADAVTGRYVKVEFTSSYQTGGIVAASIIRAVELARPVPPAGDATAHDLTADGFTVTVAEEFPQALSYSLDGESLAGQPELLSGFRINGVDQQATTAFEAVDDATARYVSTVPGLGDLEITSTITVAGNGRVVFEIEDISGAQESSVNTIAIPGQSLVRVSSTDDGASLSRTRIDTDSTRTADRFISLTDETNTDAASVGAPYAFVSTDALAASVYSNATPDQEQGAGTATNSRLSTQITADADGVRHAQLASGAWVWAPRGATDERVARYENPRAEIVVTGDRNGVNGVDWQDAAILLRDVLPAPKGADRVPERVAQRIPFNIASETTNPFLKTLDNTKRISLATDDLGQWVLLKGYTSEGHDSANTDYGSNFNERAGGLEDMNSLVETGDDYNADFAVHVNTTEVYEQADAFSERLIQGKGLGWNWLNQSHLIDQRYDLGEGHVLDRFQELRDKVPGLDTIYIDVYYSSGWLAESLASQLHGMGFELASEWAYSFEGDSIWSHWASDKQYGGVTNKGINSAMVRFIGNTNRDVWNVDPLLGGTVLRDFEGWSAKDDWNVYYEGIWKENLPTKYLQHFPITSYEQGVRATFEAPVEARIEDGTRVVTQNGAEVLRGDTYLLPWGETNDEGISSPLDADKMYLYSGTGVTRAFTLTDAFDGVTDFVQYRLTDSGRVKVADVSAQDGELTLTADANTPYVVVPVGTAPPVSDVDFGEHTGIVDPGFNGDSLDPWSPTGGAEIIRTPKGDPVVRLGIDESGISQQVDGLEPGARYALGAYVEIGPRAERSTALTVTGDGVDAENRFEVTPARNYVGSDTKHNTYMQRATVEFTAPDSGTVTIGVSAAEGDPAVTIDDLRVQKIETLDEGETIGEPIDVPEDALFWDFEDNQPGWGPFVRGGASGLSDAATSISRLNLPFTQKEWKNAHAPFNTGAIKGKAIDDVLNGAHSLKAHYESDGLLYRTIPARAPFIPGHEYEVSLSYQSSNANVYSWVLGTDDVEAGTSSTLRTTPLGFANETKRLTQNFIASCASDWVGLSKAGTATGSDLVIDDVVIRDLGATGDEPGCARVTVDGSDGEFAPGVTSTLTTTFTNSENTPVTNIGVALADVPEGWTAQVAEENGNLFDSVAPGETVSTQWLLTPAAGTAPGVVEISAAATYDVECKPRTVRGYLNLRVAERAAVPLSSITPTASSQQPNNATEGNVRYAFDNNTSTLWHTSWTPTPFPHWVQMDLGSTYSVDGLGYLNRTSGGQNGRIQDYTVQVSADGTNWTEVAAGAFQADSASYQNVDFPEVDVRYVKLNALSSHNGLQFAAAAELRVYGTGGTPPTGFAPGERTADPDCDDESQAPGAPRDVEAVVDDDGVVLSWTAPESDGGSDISEYRIYREGSDEPIGSVDAATTTFRVGGLQAGTSQRFAVAAVNETGEGARSEWTDAVTVPGSPVRASVVPRCLGGKVYVYVSVLNEGAGPVDVRVSSDVGVKSFRGVQPGKSGSAALSARAASIGDGQVGVAVTGADGVENEFSVAYDAISCR
ncbi:hypothetical protein E8P82_06795 [Arthrobacter echini]|uniref:Endo-alpha-N-acetylgalactosaminidase n=1 Tax=Arthrobacter echini TaxID=1529066 RepID=A0A4S5E6H1_9MICC|nr:endo-alpha-N-acetylgalactosaminidase family protein [Arthrobacter echini]THJ67138.1 hypothetical protein E8P82_06795 [Arthrobacter echini]